MAENTKSDSS